MKFEELSKQEIVDYVIEQYKKAISTRVDPETRVPDPNDIWIIENSVNLTLEKLGLLKKLKKEAKGNENNKTIRREN